MMTSKIAFIYCTYFERIEISILYLNQIYYYFFMRGESVSKNFEKGVKGVSCDLLLESYTLITRKITVKVHQLSTFDRLHFGEG